MGPRSLAELGLDVVPALSPLSYPGRPVTRPALLVDDLLVPLRARPGPLGDWPAADRNAWSLDAALAALGADPAGRRHPVLAVGSNASPAQLAHKLAGRGLPVVVPMVPVRVRGIGVGCSAHVGRNGYAPAAPYADPAAEHTLVAAWFDAAQLAAVDATEPAYRRVPVTGPRFTMALPSGAPLPAAGLYVSRYGTLADPATGRPRPGGGNQRALLTALLASPRLAALLGPGPEAWIARARADAAARAEGARIYLREGWVCCPGPGFWGDDPNPAAGCVRCPRTAEGPRCEPSAALR
ncbi:hypothetical protein ACIHFE_06710 [Streptomyces sp. NPDC052396]|uniref:hypothetical protein n=1 Tax=Streptomyces sp. NPDC052396 TaxID=3365689 RepID=UPI0037D26697